MGVVSTNVCVIKSGGSGGGANGADLPTHLKALSANGGNGFVTLSLEYENTDYVSGVQVNYKTGDYPTSPSDGESVSVDGAQTYIKVEGLTNKLEYYFRVFPYNEVDGVKYYQTDVTNAKTECSPRAIEIIGATIFEEGDGYIALITSQDFTISAPEGTKITLAGGGTVGQNNSGGFGGYIQQYVLSTPIDNQQCSLNIGGATKTYGVTKLTNTTLSIGGDSYTSGTQCNKTVETKFGIIGGRGKNGDNDAYRPYEGVVYYWGKGGDGGGARAGNGGACSVTANTSTHVLYYGGDGGGGIGATKGGSEYRMKNLNSSGTTWTASGGKGVNGCGNGGSSSATYQNAYSDDEEEEYFVGGSGGGGGFGGGGGGGGGRNYNGSYAAGSPGYGGQGICVIEYPT